MFRNLDDIAQMFGGLAVTGMYVVHAATDDEITHLANLYVRSRNDMVIRFDCRPLLIDGYGDALAHLRKPETQVDCMACLVRETRIARR